MSAFEEAGFSEREDFPQCTEQLDGSWGCPEWKAEWDPYKTPADIQTRDWEEGWIGAKKVAPTYDYTPYSSEEDEDSDESYSQGERKVFHYHQPPRAHQESNPSPSSTTEHFYDRNSPGRSVW